MRKEMKTAYALLGSYKSGAIEPGTQITQEQDHLIRMLATDLDVEVDGLDIGMIVSRVARADTRWNHETMAAVCEFYDRRGAGADEEAEAIRSQFFSRCPSVWYCGVLADL